jgi:uncharacterized protein (TIGR03086 family)
MDNVDLMQRVVDETGNLVEGTRDDQLSNGTPCTEWTVRDLINHLTGGATMFSISCEEGAVPDELVGQLLGGDNLGDDFKGAFRTAADRVMTAFRKPGVMDQIVKLPFGEMPANIALTVAITDVAIHACDLAKATGQPMPPDDVLESALAMGHQVIAPEFRMPGVFDPAQPVADDAPIADRLLAFGGRKI